MTRPKPKQATVPIVETPRHVKGSGSISWEPTRNTYRASVLIDGKAVRRRHADRAFLEQWTTDKLAAAQAAKQSPGLVDTTDWTVGDAMDAWFAQMELADRPLQGTREEYQNVDRRDIRSTLGPIRIDSLTEYQVRAVIERHLKLRQTRSAQQTRLVLRGALKVAKRKRARVPEDVTEYLATTIPNAEKAVMITWTEEEANSYLDYIRSTEPRYLALYTLALQCGMRRSEIIGLTWRHVDLRAKKIGVQQAVRRLRTGISVGRTKSKSGRRTIMLPAAVVNRLIEWRDIQEAERVAAGNRWVASGYVFTTPTGNCLDPRNMNRHFDRTIPAHNVWARLNGKPDIPVINLHGLRHTCATILLLRNVYVKIVSSMLGHASIAITLNYYAHVLPSDQHVAVAAMDGIFGDGESPGRGSKIEK